MSGSENPTLRERIAAAAREGSLRSFLGDRVSATDGAWAVVADITDGCRQGCLTCPAGPPSVAMDAETAEAMGAVMIPHAEFLAVGCLAEPMLHPDVAARLRSLSSIKSRTGSGTFLCLLTAATQRSGGPLAGLGGTGLDVLLVSADATEAAAYAQVRGGASWEETRARLADALPGLGRAGVRLGAQVMLLRVTAPHARRTAEDLAGLGFSSLTFTQPTQVPPRAAGQVLRRDDREFGTVAALEAWIAAGAGPAGMRISLPRLAPADAARPRALFGDGATWDEDRLPGPGICVAPWYNLRIDSAGRVFPCNFMAAAGDAVGHVGRDGFEDIAGGPRARSLREALLAGRSPTASCRRCAYGPEARS
jgi:radical SAM protein with 4Fe4S-binding SPASM domain